MDKAIHNERNTEEVLVGTFCGSGRGFGFVSCPDLEEDIFISARDTAGAFHGDDVQVQIICIRLALKDMKTSIRDSSQEDSSKEWQLQGVLQ